jgi:hypothetical protein
MMDSGAPVITAGAAASGSTDMETPDLGADLVVDPVVDLAAAVVDPAAAAVADLAAAAVADLAAAAVTAVTEAEDTGSNFR